MPFEHVFTRYVVLVDNSGTSGIDKRAGNSFQFRSQRYCNLHYF